MVHVRAGPEQRRGSAMWPGNPSDSRPDGRAASRLCARVGCLRAGWASSAMPPAARDTAAATWSQMDLFY